MATENQEIIGAERLVRLENAVARGEVPIKASKLLKK